MSDSNAVIQRHAVMVRWQDHGLLICGPPGIGKSSLALAILSQSGQLIADDCVDIIRREGQLIARCPPAHIGLLHSRELGLLD
ncbi:MAG: serine kinase, partial [Methylophaga sp.]